MEYTEQDNRVCMYYITDKLQRLSEIKSNKELRKEVEGFKEEMTYNLGINAMHNHYGEDKEENWKKEKKREVADFFGGEVNDKV